MITVQTLTGKRFDIQGDENTLVGDVKRAIKQAYLDEGAHVPMKNQRLVLPKTIRGRRTVIDLSDSRPLSDYGIDGFTILILMMKN